MNTTGHPRRLTGFVPVVSTAVGTMLKLAAAVLAVSGAYLLGDAGQATGGATPPAGTGFMPIQPVVAPPAATPTATPAPTSTPTVTPTPTKAVTMRAATVVPAGAGTCGGSFSARSMVIAPVGVDQVNYRWLLMRLNEANGEWMVYRASGGQSRLLPHNQGASDLLTWSLSVAGNPGWYRVDIETGPAGETTAEPGNKFRVSC